MPDYFDTAYEGKPPWDIGRAQAEIVRLADENEITGPVLDVGCGTGENALYLAGLGFEVWGIDGVPAAIDLAREKAAERGITAKFIVGDALDLASLGQKFDTIIDCGLFHSFSDAARAQFVESLSSALNPGGTYFMLCFSDREPGGYGPRRITQDEIRAAFQRGWTVNFIRPAEFETNMADHRVQAWLSSISVTASAPGVQ